MRLYRQTEEVFSNSDVMETGYFCKKKQEALRAACVQDSWAAYRACRFDIFIM